MDFVEETERLTILSRNEC